MKLFAQISPYVMTMQIVCLVASAVSVQQAGPLVSLTILPSLLTIAVVLFTKECEKGAAVWAVFVVKVMLLCLCLLRFRRHVRYSVFHAAASSLVLLAYYFSQDLALAYDCDVRAASVVASQVCALAAYAGLAAASSAAFAA